MTKTNIPRTPTCPNCGRPLTRLSLSGQIGFCDFHKQWYALSEEAFAEAEEYFREPSGAAAYVEVRFSSGGKPTWKRMSREEGRRLLISTFPRESISLS